MYPKKRNKKISIAMDNVQKHVLNDFFDDFFQPIVFGFLPGRLNYATVDPVTRLTQVMW